MNRFYCIVGYLILVLVAPAMLHAQAADVSLPAHRQNVVTAAEKLLVQRANPEPIADPAPNPFVWLPEPEADQASAVAEEPPKAVAMSMELLVRLASRIPASGTVILGGEPLLLLGQKRLKAGDVITISFEGENYELSIENITSTSFTVRRGSLTHTRPTFQPASNTPAPRK
jgi:hypothetical protein